ncbi:MAG: carbohydrate kinase family protein [SAR324 cluster bacterium]|nr:carbohydrate kinase family protein [SAR324 cluster bacterium]
MQTDKKFDVIGMGGCAIDMVGMVNSLPKRDTKQKMSRFIRQAGGTVANALVGLARLGVKCSYLGKLGDNDFSHLIINEFCREGIDSCEVIIEDQAGPYLAFVIVEKTTGDRTVLWTDEMVCNLKAQEISKDYVSSGKVLYLDDWGFHDIDTALQAIRWAKEAQMLVVLDAENHQKREYLTLFNMVDFLIIGQEYALECSSAFSLGAAAEYFIAQGTKNVVITQGPSGCMVKTNERYFSQSAFKVQVVDTLGCGDAFHAGFIYGLLQGYPIEIVTEFACAVAALKCKKLGPRTGLPTIDIARDFLCSQGSQSIRSVINPMKYDEK